MDLAQQLALQLKKGDVVALTGDLGTGKTIFAKGLIMALGYKSHISSPTYTIQQTYRTPSLTIHHIDLYRLATEDDVDMLDLEACWQNEAITVIEWADRANPQQLPHNTWHVAVRSTSEAEVRIIQVSPPNDANQNT